MTRLIIIITVLVCVTAAAQKQHIWAEWNDLSSLDKLMHVNNYVYPPLPNGYRRFPNHTLRKNQYRYVAGTPIVQCSVYCLPRSFLVAVGKTLLCQLDMSRFFHGMFKEEAKRYCLPDLNGNNELCAKYGYKFHSGTCKANKSGKDYQMDYDCCFDDDSKTQYAQIKKLTPRDDKYTQLRLKEK